MNKGKYFYLLLYPCKTDKTEYEAITLGKFDTDEQAIVYASKAYYEIDRGVLVVRMIAMSKCVLEEVK